LTQSEGCSTIATMSKENEVTLQTYEEKGKLYAESTPERVTPGWTRWLEWNMDLRLIGSKILEIGSGSGRDADLMDQIDWMHGDVVDRTDAAQSFVDYQLSQGHDARRLNILTDPIEGQYGMVYASAVFHHFSDDDLHLALEKIYNCLLPGGVLAFTHGRGSEELWESEVLTGNPRYYHPRLPGKLWDIVEDDFYVHRMDQIILENQRQALPHPEGLGKQWLLVTAVKQ
jgi:SAM-dependent methyltransferase